MMGIRLNRYPTSALKAVSLESRFPPLVLSLMVDWPRPAPRYRPPAASAREMQRPLNNTAERVTDSMRFIGCSFGLLRFGDQASYTFAARGRIAASVVTNITVAPNGSYRPTVIESLNTALDKYTGTLVFVSHDREFASSLATRIIELRPGEAAAGEIRFLRERRRELMRQAVGLEVGRPQRHGRELAVGGRVELDRQASAFGVDAVFHDGSPCKRARPLDLRYRTAP